MQMTIKGWLKDPHDVAFKAFDTVQHLFKAAPKAQEGHDYDIPHEPPVYDQGDWGACVLNATCGAMNIVLAVEGLQIEQLSRMFLYHLCREKMGTLHEDSGTYPYLAVERVGKIGICQESMFPYTDKNMYSPPGPECFPAASDNKATAWLRIRGNGKARLDQLETAIRSNHPVIYGSPVSRALQSYVKGDVLTIPKRAESIGGHSTVFTGVRYLDGQRVWRVRNSWGKSFGDNGHFLMDDAWAGWSQLDDLWVLTRLDALLF